MQLTVRRKGAGVVEGVEDLERVELGLEEREAVVDGVGVFDGAAD